MSLVKSAVRPLVGSLAGNLLAAGSSVPMYSVNFNRDTSNGGVNPTRANTTWSPNRNTPTKITLKVRPSLVDGNNQWLLSSAYSAALDLRWGWNSKFYARMQGTTGGGTDVESPVLSAGAVYALEFEWEPQNTTRACYLRVNGTQYTFTMGTAANTGTMCIGAIDYPAGGNLYGFTGVIQEVKIYESGVLVRDFPLWGTASGVISGVSAINYGAQGARVPLVKL